MLYIFVSIVIFTVVSSSAYGTAFPESCRKVFIVRKATYDLKNRISALYIDVY